MLGMKYQTALRLEATATATLLRGCPCGEIHPLARKPPVSSPVCLGCGKPVARPELRVGQGRWLDLAIRVGDRLLKAGAWLFKQAERF